jgi:endoglucanase
MNARWLFPLLLSIVLLAGCAQPTAAPSPTTPATNTPVPSPTPVPTSTPTPVARAEPAAPIDPFAQIERLGRGVNLGNALEAPNEGEWGMVLQAEYFRLIAEAGLGTVRVPIRWSAHALVEAPYTVDEAFFERIDWVIENAFLNGLNVVLNMHNYDEIFQEPSQHTERFVAIWKQIATRYRYMPDNLFFEPLNEPHDQLTPDKWNKVLVETVSAIREVDGVHTLILGGAEWGSITGLSKLQIPAGEENVIVTFHYYEPFPFTHQGADWVDDEYGTTGVQWPGPPEQPLEPIPAAQEIGWLRTWFEAYNTQPTRYNPCSPDAMIKDLDWAVRWGEKLGKPVWLGEFGAYSTADMQSRINWTTTVREEAEKRGFAWAYWEFGAGFGVYDRQAGQWNEGLLHVLVPED